MTKKSEPNLMTVAGRAERRKAIEALVARYEAAKKIEESLRIVARLMQAKSAEISMSARLINVSQSAAFGCRLCEADQRQRDIDAVLRDLADVDSARIMRAEIDTLRAVAA